MAPLRPSTHRKFTSYVPETKDQRPLFAARSLSGQRLQFESNLRVQEFPGSALLSSERWATRIAGAAASSLSHGKIRLAPAYLHFALSAAVAEANWVLSTAESTANNRAHTPQPLRNRGRIINSICVDCVRIVMFRRQIISDKL